jgi:hypothetical protein
MSSDSRRQAVFEPPGETRSDVQLGGRLFVLAKSKAISGIYDRYKANKVQL